MADAQHLRLVAVDPGDEAADLGGADVERRNQAAARADDRLARLPLPLLTGGSLGVRF